MFSPRPRESGVSGPVRLFAFADREADPKGGMPPLPLLQLSDRDQPLSVPQKCFTDGAKPDHDRVRFPNAGLHPQDPVLGPNDPVQAR